MRRKSIYVEIDIKTDIDSLWERTQTPELHEQWDLRFSKIEYLPRGEGEREQRFRYQTRIGFGLAIAGTGITKASDYEGTDGRKRLSVLTFGSDQYLSLIHKGGGYWKYMQNGEGMTFSTRYDYQTRCGVIGRWFDYLFFRPLFGFATAWSFDCLRIWLEKNIPPAVSLQRTVIHYFSVLMISLLWLYEGLIPKIVYPQAGELVILQHTGWFGGWEAQVLQLLGIAEIGIGVIAVLGHRKAGIYKLQITALLALAGAALFKNPDLLQAPFNPLTLSVPMIGFCLVAGWSGLDLPQASRCSRKPIRPEIRTSIKGEVY
ncbi:DoxX-like family protein [Paenibacillus solisilvae]|uniref:DoxX-like family protein n=1 Tax=Paenibacillus solisilvae TaxID=2486751 RepID=A0ABW0VZW6_9BACL